jgi:SAM-dependent methyltransferase
MLSGLMRRMHAPIYAARLRELVRCIVPHLQEGDRVLDVGCGFGHLLGALAEADGAPRIETRGLERVRREGELVAVDAYDGGTMPYGDGSFDVVILADVLHHEADPDHLIDECARVASRLVIIKDHLRQGMLAQSRISFIDWAANAPYGVPCLYRYNTLKQWRASHCRHGLQVVEERTRMTLYPFGVNMVFGRGLQYLAVLRKSASASDSER